MSFTFTENGYPIVPIDWDLSLGDQRDILLQQRNGKAVAARKGEIWSGPELAYLKDAYLEGDGLSYLAAAFQRPEHEIVEVLERFGLLTPTGGRVDYGTYPPEMQMCEYCRGPGCPFYADGEGICHGDVGIADNPFLDHLAD